MVYYTVYPICPNSFTCNCLLQWVIGLVQRLPHYQYWILIVTPLRNPVVALCQGDRVALDLQEQALHVLQLFPIEVDAGPTQSAGFGPG